MTAPSATNVLPREDDHRLADLGRRLATIPFVLLLFVAASVTAPAWIVVAAAIDLAFRGRRTTLRCLAFLYWYLLCEVGGLLGILLVNVARLRGREGFQDANRRLQIRWARAIFLGARLTFRVRFEMRHGEAMSHGPLLLLFRHATVIDTLIASLAAEGPYGLRVRYVLKSELLWDPCLDIVGRRMGYHYARRGTGETAREVERIARLGVGLGPRDAVLIYPEGTRFTDAKRARILARLEERGEAARLERARSLTHVLPPKLEGTLALLDAARDADVVVCAHTGLEAATSFHELWSGSALDGVLRAECWRVPRSEIPKDRAGRIAWLHAQWQRVNTWVETQRRG